MSRILFRIADKNKGEKKDEQNDSTGLENANSTDQLLPWVRERGYPLKNLRKQNIELVLKDPEVKMTKECRDVLEARLEAGSISYKKLSAILRNLSPDDRLRYQFIFMGSSRCGRWSGDAVQLHNMARPDGTFEDLDNVIKARNFVYLDDYESLTKIFYNEKKKRNYSPLEISRNIDTHGFCRASREEIQRLRLERYRNTCRRMGCRMPCIASGLSGWQRPLR